MIVYQGSWLKRWADSGEETVTFIVFEEASKGKKYNVEEHTNYTIP